ncbi:MAG: dTDP-glucose 4,6-dehydratase [Candidatus Moranbacteria bacterium RIFCSPHIGHO2_02_FULL_40_12b]|nr:MAG: dTDP-glucose 4,6-dehydratase [Candidatus Moranbacteria bacterium RIFCSPHIGHO2_02_FULL_40_12b]
MLVCGGCGFMGSNFIHYVLDNFPNTKIINLDLLTYAGSRENLKGIPLARYRFVKGDIGNKKLVNQLMRGSDFVVNFAAETHVDRSIHGETSDFVHTNIDGVHSLLEALRNSPNVKKMIQISTDEVWGDLSLSSKLKFNEDSPFKPNSPYSASKAAGDLLVRSYVKTYGVPAIVSHSVNNFGPRQFPEKLIPFFTLLAMQNKSLPLYGDGKNVRDWLYVDDHTVAILTMLEKGGGGEVYAVSRDEEYSNVEIANNILNMLDKPKNLITFIKDRPGHDRRYSVDSSKLRRFGWRPKYSIREQLKKTINWYKQNPNWIRKVLKKSRDVNKHIKLGF